MKETTIKKASKLTSPNPLSLICTRKADGSTNLAAVSFWTYLAFNPGKIGFAMGFKSYTGKRMWETGEAVLVIPGADLKEAVIKCGSSTGENTDKVQKFSIEMEDLPGTKIQVPRHGKAAFHLKLDQIEEVGDHYLYICSVEQVFENIGEEALFAWEGYSKIAPAKEGTRWY